MGKKRVLVGMSGGVDSSVAAAVLKEQGYDVTGASMRLWTYSDLKKNAVHENDVVKDAKKVCGRLGIEFLELDFSELFRKKVVDSFVEEYMRGRTPNPCIACNRFLKFGAMYEAARSMGFDYMATGHYARIEREDSDRYILRTAEIKNKDQSYVLYRFTQEQLAHTLMPLGAYDKAWVREKAKSLGLAAADKPESMEICFTEDKSYSDFIEEYTGIKSLPGDILDASGNVIGRHRGLIYYTIGQRKGIGAYGRPMFVMSIDPDNNTITLGESGMEFSQYLYAEDVSFISGEVPEKPIAVQAKIRYLAKPADAVIEPCGDRVKVVFSEPQRAVTPGQAVVFYDGDVVLGGGIVASR